MQREQFSKSQSASQPTDYPNEMDAASPVRTKEFALPPSAYFEKTLAKMEETRKRPGYPLSAFCQYSQLCRDRLKEQHPDVPQLEILEWIKRDWKQLPEKKMFLERAKADYKAFKRLTVLWKSKYSPSRAQQAEEVPTLGKRAPKNLERNLSEPSAIHLSRGQANSKRQKRGTARTSWSPALKQPKQQSLRLAMTQSLNEGGLKKAVLCSSRHSGPEPAASSKPQGSRRETISKVHGQASLGIQYKISGTSYKHRRDSGRQPKPARSPPAPRASNRKLNSHSPLAAQGQDGEAASSKNYSAISEYASDLCDDMPHVHLLNYVPPEIDEVESVAAAITERWLHTNQKKPE